MPCHFGYGLYGTHSALKAFHNGNICHRHAPKPYGASLAISHVVVVFWASLPCFARLFNTALDYTALSHTMLYSAQRCCLMMIASMLCLAVPGLAMPCHAMPGRALPRLMIASMLCPALPCLATPRLARPCHAAPRQALPCRVYSCLSNATTSNRPMPILRALPIPTKRPASRRAAWI